MPISLRDKIIGYVTTNHQARVSSLVRDLTPISRVSVHRQLKKLTEEGILQKVGKAPVVFYVLASTRAILPKTEVSSEIRALIEKNYLYISPQGQLLYGFEGFSQWAANTKQSDNVAHLAELYFKTRTQYNGSFSKDGWIDATSKLAETFSETNVDKLLYADFYNLPQFGKTKLGTLMLYAKQSQNIELAKSLCLNIKPLVEKIVGHFKIDAVAYIPPSIPRGVQFMTELAVCLNLALPKIELVKTRTGQVIVAQKTLAKLEERVVNARDTIFVKDTQFPFTKILLIDDAVGSGASMNETAKKIRNTFTSVGQIIGFAVVGSVNSKKFEVISEV